MSLVDKPAGCRIPRDSVTSKDSVDFFVRYSVPLYVDTRGADILQGCYRWALGGNWKRDSLNQFALAQRTGSV